MLESSQLYQRWTRALIQVDADPGILQSFMRLRATVSEQSKVIVHFFPQYTPHDATRHLEQLFALADRVLGTALYDKLNAAELSMLAFALYCHDWGMALSNEEREAISGMQTAPDLRLLPNEARIFEATAVRLKVEQNQLVAGIE